MKVKAQNTAAFSTSGAGQPGTIGDLDPVTLLAAGTEVTPNGVTANNSHNVAYTQVTAPGQLLPLWVRTSSLEQPQPIAPQAVKAAPPPPAGLEILGRPWWQIALFALGVLSIGTGTYLAVRRK